MHKVTLYLNETYKSASERGKEKTPKHAFLMIHYQLLMIFLRFSPSSSLRPPCFCQISSAGPSGSWSLAYRLHYSPKASPSAIIFLCLSPTLPPALMGTKVFPPSCHLRPPSPLLSFPPSCLQRPDPCLSPLLLLLPK